MRASRDVWSILPKGNPRRAAKARMVIAETCCTLGRINGGTPARAPPPETICRFVRRGARGTPPLARGPGNR
jgi:hypothetical protein